jgi:hypothetical protein
MEADNGPAVVDPLFGSQAMLLTQSGHQAGQVLVRRGNKRFGLQLA